MNKKRSRRQADVVSQIPPKLLSRGRTSMKSRLSGNTAGEENDQRINNSFQSKRFKVSSEDAGILSRNDGKVSQQITADIAKSAQDDDASYKANRNNKHSREDNSDTKENDTKSQKLVNDTEYLENELNTSWLNDLDTSSLSDVDSETDTLILQSSLRSDSEDSDLDLRLSKTDPEGSNSISKEAEKTNALKNEVEEGKPSYDLQPIDLGTLSPVETKEDETIAKEDPIQSTVNESDLQTGNETQYFGSSRYSKNAERNEFEGAHSAQVEISKQSPDLKFPDDNGNLPQVSDSSESNFFHTSEKLRNQIAEAGGINTEIAYEEVESQIDGSHATAEDEEHKTAEEEAGEEYQQHRKEALEAMSEIEVDFAKLRDKVYYEKSMHIDYDLQKVNDERHPDLISLHKQMEALLDKRRSYSEKLHEKRKSELRKKVRSIRNQLHFQFLFEKYRLRRRMIDQFGYRWCELHRARQDFDLDVPDYGYDNQLNTAQKIRDRRCIEYEIQILQNLSDYLGFPGSPCVFEATSDEIEHDFLSMRANSISLRTSLAERHSDSFGEDPPRHLSEGENHESRRANLVLPKSSNRNEIWTRTASRASETQAYGIYVGDLKSDGREFQKRIPTNQYQFSDFISDGNCFPQHGEASVNIGASFA